MISNLNYLVLRSKATILILIIGLYSYLLLFLDVHGLAHRLFN